MTGSNSAKTDRETLQNFEIFKQSSSKFSHSANEMMTATVRMQMLMLDDTRMVLGEMADILSHASRDRREKNTSEE